MWPFRPLRWFHLADSVSLKLLTEARVSGIYINYVKIECNYNNSCELTNIQIYCYKMLLSQVHQNSQKFATKILKDIIRYVAKVR